MPEISIITCISRPDVYNKCLLDSINKNRKNHDIEIIPIINNDNKYSASNALNIGIDVARSNILVFAHQDVRLLHGWFDRLVDALSKLDDNWGVIGSAGIALQYGRNDIGRWGGSVDVQTVAVGSVWDTDENLTQPPYWDGIKEITPVHCIDECVFVLNRRTGLRFDSMFTGFHFYGVDMCLQARAAAYSVYGTHLPMIHYGQYSASFTGDRKYWVYFRFLHHKWSRRFPELLGTHMHWAPGELTSYISIGLEDDESGTTVQLKAMGIDKSRFRNDKDRGFIDEV